ncbi:MAG: hypothetical protein AB7I50_08675 [Vicinamibacterales bacterium]
MKAITLHLPGHMHRSGETEVMGGLFLNTVNYNGFVENLLSPYFGRATSAAPPRRIEVGAAFSF